MTKQPVDDLLYSLGFRKNVLEGALNMEASLSAKGGEKKDLISGLTGSADLHIEEGRIKRKGIVFKVMDVLSIQNIYKGRLPDFSKEGFCFEDIEGHFDIKEGIFKTDNLTMKSPVFNAVALGKIVPANKKVKFVVWVQTLETMDTLVSKVPIIGYILTGKDKSPQGVVVYPVKVKGRWSDPEVKYVPSVKQLGGGVINIIKRILLTPGRIFKDISEMTEKPAKEGVPVPEEGSELDGSTEPHRIP